jgi:catechol 2,3-dioxygenase
MPAGLITGLRGVDLGVPDVAAHARFYTEVWRLAVAAERGGAVYLRDTGAYHHILALHAREHVV